MKLPKQAQAVARNANLSAIIVDSNGINPSFWQAILPIATEGAKIALEHIDIPCAISKCGGALAGCIGQSDWGGCLARNAGPACLSCIK